MGRGWKRAESAPRQSLTRQTDLRSLKSTVALRQLSSKDRAMAEKELMLAVAAYNVVRAVQCRKTLSWRHGLICRAPRRRPNSVP